MLNKFELIEIDNIDYENFNDIVYDLEVEEDHSYVVGGGIAVHNSVCTTRIVAGIGIPQLSAVVECGDAAHGILNGRIISDGGIVCPADVSKAFGANADFVMIGSYFAGTDECSAEWVEVSGEEKSRQMKHYGMSSEEAMNKFSGGIADYRAAEGKSVLVSSKGPVKKIIQEILGGIRSSCSYVGCCKIKDLSKCTTFVRVNRTHNKTFER